MIYIQRCLRVVRSIPPVINDDWFDESVKLPYPYDGVPQEEKTIHQKMYELSSKILTLEVRRP